MTGIKNSPLEFSPL